jgi:putative ABC transport system substrate-binding protein
VGRWAEAKKDRLPGLAAEMVGLKVGLIVALGAPAAEAAKEATSTIPIVVVNVGDPVGIGLIASLARPGGNVSGISDQATELSAKRLDLLKEAMPNASNIAVLWNAGDRAMTLRYREIEKAARMLGVTIRPLGVREPDDFDVAFTAMTRERPDALLLITDALTSLNRGRILDFAAGHFCAWRASARSREGRHVNDTDRRLRRRDRPRSEWLCRESGKAGRQRHRSLCGHA